MGLTRLRRWAVLWASLFIAITGSIGTVFGPLLEMKSVGGAFGLAMAFALWLPFLRVPPLWAMAVLGAPNEMAPEAQVLQAVTAAQKMQALMPTLNEQWRKLGIGEALQIRVGVNTGVLSVGSFGSQGRMTYTAVGLQTNIASQIETAAEPGEILISDASYQLIRDQIDCDSRGEVECKGVHFPVQVYSPIRRP